MKAWSRRDTKNPGTGLSDKEARVGRGKRGEFFLGYKAHCGGDWNSESPVAYVVASANENEKRHFKKLASQARERFPNARWHVGDPQYRQGWKTVFRGSGEGVTGGLGPAAAWSILDPQYRLG